MQVSRTRLQLSQKLWVSGVMKPSRRPVSAHRRHSGPGRRCGSRSRSASSAPRAWARTSDSGRYWSSRVSPPMSPIGMTSMKVRSKPSSPHHAISRSNSSSLTPFSATQLILMASPASRAALRPASTLSSLPQRVIASNLCGSSVSMQTLMRRTPRRVKLRRVARELAAVGGQRQLVERAGVQMAAERADQVHDAPADQRLAAGQAQLA